MGGNLEGREIAGRYQIESFVGAGAMGEVYRARQIALGTTVAVKVMHPHLASEPTFAARFLREAKAASRIDHPSSIRVLDFGEEAGGLFYMVMEYLDGRTLDAVLEEERSLPVRRIVHIASQVLAALAVAHDKGVIHRDLKPANIMLVRGEDDDGEVERVKVCDFGVARLVDGRGERQVTAEGLIIGTPEYMSPEQARGEPLDARSDIYSMGVLLFHLMTGSVPFDSETPLGTALMHVNDEPTRPTILDPRIDERLEAICLRAMRKKPEERHASARELRVALLSLLDDAGAPVSGLREQLAPRRQRLGLAVWGVGLAAIALSARVVLGGAPHEEPVGTATLTNAEPKGPAPAPAPPPAPKEAVPEPAPSAAAEAAKAEEAAKEIKPARNARRAPEPRARRPRGGAPSNDPAPKGEPAKAEAAPPKPAPKAEAAPAKPEPTKPAKAEAAPAKPEPTKPAKAEAAPAKPEPTKAAPKAEPAPLPEFPVPQPEAPPLPN